MICHICSEQAVPFARTYLLRKYDIQYFQCEHCGFVQTEKPYWLKEAYENAINNSDIGLVSRNISFARSTRAVILALFDSGAQFIDYGGGYGLFVRMMRDMGIDYYWSDKFCDNLFAKGFEVGTNNGRRYELLTAFEVFEHLVDPISEIEQMLCFSRNILFSTLLIPNNNPRPNEWWYYGLEHGQHVSLYTSRSLRALADRTGLNLYSNGKYLHLLTEKKILSPMFSLISRHRVSMLINFCIGRLLKRDSLLEGDYFKITGSRIN